MSRDPVEEQGGINTYAFCVNAPNEMIDKLGNLPTRWGTPNIPPVEKAIDLLFPEDNPCKNGEFLAYASSFHYVGFQHFREYLPENKGKIELFNYLEFELPCKENFQAGDARPVELHPLISPFPNLYINAGVAHAPGSPDYSKKTGIVRLSVQSRVFLLYEFNRRAPEPGELIENLKKTIAVCYKCSCRRRNNVH